MDIVVSILAIVAGIVGILGSILPGLPGTPISWVGLLLLYIWGNGTNAAGDPVTTKMLLVWGVVVAVVSVIDYFVPMYFTKLTGGSRHAERGAMVGLILGIIFTPEICQAALRQSCAGIRLKAAMQPKPRTAQRACL